MNENNDYLYERMNGLDNRITKLEENQHKNELNQKDNYRELENLITSAVEKGNEKLLVRIEEHDKRIRELENADGKKAKNTLVTIFTTSLSWLVLGVLSNLPVIINATNK